MTLIEIAPLENGAHRNYTVTELTELPEGWAVIPDVLLDTWETAKPFVSVTAFEGTVTELIPLTVPEPEPEVPEIKPEDLADYSAVYAGLVTSGSISITDVPEDYRAAVQYTVIQNLS